jgi:hypothetical protein
MTNDGSRARTIVVGGAIAGITTVVAVAETPSDARAAIVRELPGLNRDSRSPNIRPARDR